jgi:hypothetical protein
VICKALLYIEVRAKQATKGLVMVLTDQTLLLDLSPHFEVELSEVVVICRVRQ